MACACSKKRQTYQVVATNGKVVYSSTFKSAAEGVSKRYPDSKVVEVPKAGATTA